MIRTVLAQLQLAVMLLTRLPAGRLPDPVPQIGAAAWAFPLAGLGPGLIGAGVMAAALAMGLAPGLAAGLALAAQVAVTGALHEDGLADFADGVWGGRDRAGRLAIMRDSRIGSFGAVALILATGLRWQALAVLADPVVMVAVAVASRVAPVALMAWLPPARAEGLGHSARGGGLAGLGLALLFGAGAMIFLPGGTMALAVAVAAVTGLGALARARLGGQTGDVLGTGQQVAEITLLLALSR
ncbi:MAG TPA: adenosylcobinamide-GDP ribazoletransferase [Paenirhodobacter sp.]